MKRHWLAAFALVTGPAMARDSLGVFDGWGAFRDGQPLRCFAIAEPEDAGSAKWRPFASVGHWPTQRVRSQLHIRLSREKRRNADIALVIDQRRFVLKGSGGDAWAPDAKADAMIVAAIRSGKAMSVATVSESGRGFADTYRLKGAATAIDAAALGCARSR